MSLDANFRLMLRKRRAELGLTQADLAQRLGVGRVRVTQLETGENSPTLRIVDRIATALDCSPLALLVQPEMAEQK